MQPNFKFSRGSIASVWAAAFLVSSHAAEPYRDATLPLERRIEDL
jgi:hypothetical protein